MKEKYVVEKTTFPDYFGVHNKGINANTESDSKGSTVFLNIICTYEKIGIHGVQQYKKYYWTHNKVDQARHLIWLHWIPTK